MTDFNNALIDAQLDGRQVRCAPLVLFHFRSGLLGVWPGFGLLRTSGTVYGGEWQGIGSLGQLSILTSGADGSVAEMTFSLMATSEMLSTMSSDSDESIGREVEVFLQFFDVRRFDDAGNFVDWQLLGWPIQIFWGRMGPLRADKTAEDDGPAQRTLSVSAQNLFVTRGRPPYMHFSDRDQKSRSSDDNLCVRVSQLSEGSVAWPTFNS